MKVIPASLSILLALSAPVAFALPQMAVRVVGQDGKSDAADAVQMDVRRVPAADGGEDVFCRVVSTADSSRLLRIEATLPLAAGATMTFDGYEERKLTGDVSRPFFLDDTFPLGAAWGADGQGRALALGAENRDSYADFTATASELKVSVHAAFLRKGAVYELAFHAFPFDAKYGVRDAFARYYPLYPRRFQRHPKVDPAIYGISADYGAWRISDPEACRPMNATWDWCIGAARSWGDIRGVEQPTGDGRGEYTWDAEHSYRNRQGVYCVKKNADMSCQQYFEVLDERLAYGYFCGVVNAYYVMALAKISPVIAKRFPDAIAVGKTFTEYGFSYATEVFVFPELSWYRQLTNDFAQLVKERDIGAIAFDVAFPRGVFRGEKLREMRNVSWDEHGAGIVRGAGASYLFDYLRTLDCRKAPHKLGVISNSNGKHISDKLYADTVMAEQAPWDDKAPFPLRWRLVVGEKGLTLWEGFNPKQFAPDYKFWPKDAKDRLVNALARCSVHRSFFAGASLPARAFTSEYTALMSHAFVRMNDAGWKPVPGAKATDTEWEIARYGLGTGTFLAINNLARTARFAELDVFPGEIASGRAGGTAAEGCLLVPFFGGWATNAFADAAQRVSAEVGALGANVLESLGTVRGKGRLAVRWAGIPGRATLKIESIDFTGELAFKDTCDTYARVGSQKRTLAPGAQMGVVYRDDWMMAIGEAVRSKDFKVDEIVYAGDSDARDQAERVARFFKGALGKKGTPPVLRVETSLPPRTVRVGGVTLSSADRWELANRVKRFLDVLNAEVYPHYRPPVPLPSADKGRYRLFRL